MCCVDENIPSLNEIAVGYMQGIFAYWMLDWWNECALNWTGSWMHAL